jgi:hypothetical protein
MNLKGEFKKAGEQPLLTTALLIPINLSEFPATLDLPNGAGVRR